MISRVEPWAEAEPQGTSQALNLTAFVLDSEIA